MDLATKTQVAALNKAADASARKAIEQFSQLASISTLTLRSAQSQVDAELCELSWTNEELGESLRVANDEVERLRSVEQRLMALLASEQQVTQAEGAARAQLEAEAEWREAKITQLRAEAKLSAEREARAAERAAAAEALAEEHAASAAALRQSEAEDAAHFRPLPLRLASSAATSAGELADDAAASLGKLFDRRPLWLRSSSYMADAAAPQDGDATLPGGSSSESAPEKLRLQLAHATALLPVRDDELRRERAARASDAISHAALLEVERGASRQREREAPSALDAQPQQAGDAPQDQPRAPQDQPRVPHDPPRAPQVEPWVQSSEEGVETKHGGDGDGDGEAIIDTAESHAEKAEETRRWEQSQKLVEQDEVLRAQLGLPPSPSRR